MSNIRVQITYRTHKTNTQFKQNRFNIQSAGTGSLKFKSPHQERRAILAMPAFVFYRSTQTRKHTYHVYIKSGICKLSANASVCFISFHLFSCHYIILSRCCVLGETEIKLCQTSVWYSDTLQPKTSENCFCKTRLWSGRTRTSQTSPTTRRKQPRVWNGCCCNFEQNFWRFPTQPEYKCLSSYRLLHATPQTSSGCLCVVFDNRIGRH